MAAIWTAPGQLPEDIARSVDYYNGERSHEALQDVAPDGVCVGRREQILARRKTLQLQALWARRVHYRQLVGDRAGEESVTAEEWLRRRADLSRSC